MVGRFELSRAVGGIRLEIGREGQRDLRGEDGWQVEGWWLGLSADGLSGTLSTLGAVACLPLLACPRCGMGWQR